VLHDEFLSAISWNFPFDCLPITAMSSLPESGGIYVLTTALPGNTATRAGPALPRERPDEGEAEHARSTKARRPDRLSLAGRSPAWPASVSPAMRIIGFSFPPVNDLPLC
jgi:hypothetical protein